MFTTTESFATMWQQESTDTSRVLAQLTDATLGQAVVPGGRTLGRLAWHLVGTIREMPERMGLVVDGPSEERPIPGSAASIREAYDRASRSLLELVEREWDDASLATEHDMYGERWTRAFALTVLVHHQIHHRGQMTVLMRQAGLTVPGIYGPSREEWAQWGMEAPL